MSLFHKSLADMEKQVEQGNIPAALAILNNHLETEKEFMDDLAGLEVAIQAYRGKLVQLQNIPLIKKVVKIGSLQRVQSEELKQGIKEADKALTKVKALLSKLWKERRNL